MSGQLKEKAAEAYSKGKFAKAAELYGAHCAKDPQDHQSRVRLGDAWSRAGKVPQAVAAYRDAAEGFAKAGFLPRAIAASKLILELDPGHAEVQHMLADLYAKRSGPPRAKGVVLQRPAPAPLPTARAIELPPEPQPPAPAPESRWANAIELTPEAPLETVSAGPDPLIIEEPEPPPPPAPPPPAPTVPSAPVAAPPPSGGGRVWELSLDEPDEPMTVAPTPPPASPSAAAPPGLRPANRPASPKFDELELDVDAAAESLWVTRRPTAEASPGDFSASGDSLLAAVERAAELAGAADLSALELEPDPEPAAASEGEGLPEIPLFSDLDRDAFIALFQSCPLRRVNDGDRVISQGEPGNAFYVVCAGKVRVMREDGGRTRPLAELGEGTFFGEMALLTGAPRAASVEGAAEDTQLLEISSTVLSDLAKTYPGVVRALKRFGRQRMLANLIETAPLFTAFERRDRKALVERFLAKDVGPGDVLVQEGTDSDGLYVVLSGEVEVLQGKTVRAVLREGELFGEMSVLTKAPAEATVRARRRTSLLRLPRKDFDALIMSHPQVLALISELTDTRRAQGRLT